MFSSSEIIDFAVQIEQNGERLCREMAQRNIDTDLASLLEWMAEQEAQHAKWFYDLKLKLRITGKVSQMEKLGKSLLRDVLGDQSFSLQDADFSKIQNIKELLSLLIEFEKDTVLFYEMIKTAVEDKGVILILDKIIAEENQHVAQTKEYFNKRFGPIECRNGSAAKPTVHSR
ncbi:MAG: ferritin family protein [Desulfobacterales bacterium]|nr:ferritin family protein [Desulfobacterales bacterium]